MDKRINLQHFDQEERRLRATIARQEELRRRLLCPNARLNGRDENYLQKQIEEKRRKQQEEKNEDMKYAAFISKMNDDLTELELQRQDEDNERKRTAREDLLKAMEQNRNRRLNENKESNMPENYSRCSIFPKPAPFHDMSVKRRKALQQQQVRKWAMEDISRKKELKEQERAEDILYGQAIKQFQTECDKIDERQYRQKHEIHLRVQKENAKLALEKAEANRNAKQMEIAEERRLLNMGVAPVEDDQKFDIGSKAIRRDNFRGYAKSEILKIAEYRKFQIEEKKLRAEQEKQNELNWAAHSDEIIKQCHENSHREQVLKIQMERDYQTAQRQATRKRQEIKRIESRNDKKDFEECFFNKFGTSHR